MGGSSGGGGREDPPLLENHKWLNVFRKFGKDTFQGANEPGGSNCFSRDVNTVKTTLSGQKEDQKLDFNADYRLMQVKSIAECS